MLMVEAKGQKGKGKRLQTEKEKRIKEREG